MTEQDKKISRLYKETFGSVHADDGFRERVEAMKNAKRKKKTLTKVICALAAAVILVMAGTVIVSASRIEYEKVILDGNEVMARYLDYGTGTYLLECEWGNNSYTAFIHGDFDKSRDTLYFVDKGDYFLASTDPEPTLNLYTDIDKSTVAGFDKDESGNTVLCITDDAGTTEVAFSGDESDGKKDGIIRDGDTVDVYSLLPNGSVANTMKVSNIGLFDKAGRIFGYSREQFWNDLYEQTDSYNQSPMSPAS